MPVEIEAKMKVDGHDATRARLEQCGAHHVGKYFEVNAFFDTEDHSLRAADKGLRLRVVRNGPTGGEEYVITYKGPRQLGQMKSREEVELSVGGYDAATHLLEALGFRKILSFEKKRESWELLGCKVELDRVPHLGDFVEIEGPNERAVLKVRESLGLSDRPMVKASYIGLLTAHLQERGRPSEHITFEDDAVR